LTSLDCVPLHPKGLIALREQYYYYVASIACHSRSGFERGNKGTLPVFYLGKYESVPHVPLAAASDAQKPRAPEQPITRDKK